MASKKFPWASEVKEADFKEAADYSNMKIGVSNLVVYFGGKKCMAYENIGKMNIGNAKCWIVVTKTSTGAQSKMVEKTNLIAWESADYKNMIG